MAKGVPTSKDIARRPVLSSYDNYEDAQEAVDTLSDNHFPVEHLAIVGVDLRMVESVLGRMSWARAALGGAATVAWLGALVGLFVSFFGSQDVSAFEYVLLGLLYGAGFGIVFGLVSYGFNGRRRDFVSRQDIQAARYDVLCDSEVIGRARKILGLAVVWPPPLESDPQKPESQGAPEGLPSSGEQ